MKQFLAVLVILGIIGTAYAEIVNTEGEQKISSAIKQIYSQVDNARNSIGVIYAKAKLYVTDHPTQFTAGDKTKLNGLQAEITNVDTAIANLKTYITTNFNGINE